MKKQIEDGKLDLRFKSFTVEGEVYSAARISSIKSDAIRIVYFHTGQRVPIYNSTRLSIEYKDPATQTTKEVHMIAGRVTTMAEKCRCPVSDCKLMLESIEIYDALVLG